MVACELSALLICTALVLKGDQAERPASAAVGLARQLKQMQMDYDQAVEVQEKAEASATARDEKTRIHVRLSEARRKFAGEMLGIAKANAQDPSAVDALVWIVQEDGPSAEAIEAVTILLKEHANDQRTAKTARSLIYNVPCPSTERLVRGLIERGPANLAGRMRLSLAAYLSRKGDLARSLEAEGDRGKSRSHYDADMLTYLLETNPDRLIREAKQLIAQSEAKPTGAGEATADFAKKLRMEMDHFAVGQVAPEIDGFDIEHQRMRLSDYRGKVVVLKFWATWCGPCMGMVPHDRNLVSRLEGQPFALLGIESDDDPIRAKKVINEKAINWRSWWDRGKRDGPIATAWNVSGLWGWPTIFVLDGAGVIRYKGVRDQALDDAVDFLLAESKKSNTSP
jgi:thiol-disulfide isomerase/thioredoxin